MIFESDLQTEGCRIFSVWQQAQSHVHNSHTDSHTSTKTPVDGRQLMVTVQAACKQSKEQNGFQVVREKQEESAGEEEQKLNRKTQLVFVLF